MPFTIILLIFACCTLRSESNTYGGGPNSFYQIPIGARETSMGGCGIASSQSVFAPYWNPAGLLYVIEEPDFVDVGFSLNAISKNQSHINNKQQLVFGGMAFVYKEYILGINIFSRSFSGIISTDIDNIGNIYNIGNFNFSQNIFVISSAMFLFDFNVGMNAKFIYSSYSNEIPNPNYLGLGFDIGFVYPMPFFNKKDALKWGYVLKTDFDSTNTQIRQGVGIDFLISQERNVYLKLDFNAGDFIKSTAGIGVEFDLMEFIQFRFGYNAILEPSISGQYLGIGFGFIVNKLLPNMNPKIEIDFSYRHGANNYFGKYIDLTSYPFKVNIFIRT